MPLTPLRWRLLLQRLGDLEGELQGLARVEPRVAMRQVALGERGLADPLGAADAFGDVLPGQLEMHAAGIAALGVDGSRRRRAIRRGCGRRPGSCSRSTR